MKNPNEWKFYRSFGFSIINFKNYLYHILEIIETELINQV